MTIEQLDEACELRWAIVDLEMRAEMLDKAIVCVDKTTAPYDFHENEIELLPEEQDVIESLRQAYLTILCTANERKLNELKTKFDAI